MKKLPVNDLVPFSNGVLKWWVPEKRVPEDIFGTRASQLKSKGARSDNFRRMVGIVYDDSTFASLMLQGVATCRSKTPLLGTGGYQ